MRNPLDLKPEEEAAVKERVRMLCRKDLHYLAKHVLNYDRVTDHIHKRMARDVDTPGYRFKMLLWPRGSFKSTIATESGAIQRLLRDPTERILITNAKLGNSQKFLRAIANHFHYNSKFRWFWRDWWMNEYATPYDRQEQEGNLDWVQHDTQDEFTLLRPGTRREASISTAGVGASMVSQHYSVIIADDLVNREAVTTPDMVEKSILHLKDLLDLLDPDGDLIVVGTRWSYMDLYGWIIDEFGHRAKMVVPDGYLKEQKERSDESNLREDWLISVQPCYHENGDPIFPEEYDHEVLSRLEHAKGSYEFGAQYLLDPVPRESQKFREEWFVKQDTMPDLHELDVCITVDPAKSLKETADRTAIIAYGYDRANYMYLLDGVNERLTPDETPDVLFDMVRKYQHECRHFYPVGFEAVGFQEVFIYNLERMMLEYGHFFPIEPITRRQSSKEERILRLVPRLKNGFIVPHTLIKYPHGGRGEEYDLVRRLLWELTRFPFGEYDDLADATADQLNIVHAKKLPGSGPRQKDEKVVDFVHPSINEDQRRMRGRTPPAGAGYNDAVRTRR